MKHLSANPSINIKDYKIMRIGNKEEDIISSYILLGYYDLIIGIRTQIEDDVIIQKFTIYQMNKKT